MYSFANFETVHCSMSGSNLSLFDLYSCFSGGKQFVWYSHLYRNFSQIVEIRTVKVFSVVNKAEVDVFLKFSCFLCDPVDVSILIIGSSAFSKSILSDSSWFTYCWSLAWRIFSIILLACEMSAILWKYEHSLALPSFGIRMKTFFPVLWPLLSFSYLLAYWVQHFQIIIF